MVECILKQECITELKNGTLPDMKNNHTPEEREVCGELSFPHTDGMFSKALEKQLCILSWHLKGKKFANPAIFPHRWVNHT